MGSYQILDTIAKIEVWLLVRLGWIIAMEKEIAGLQLKRQAQNLKLWFM